MSGFRMKGSARRTSMLSASGVIRGGPYDCWRYVFRRFWVDARGALRIELIAGEPGWPFPRDVSLGRSQFNRLEAIKGERAPRIDTAPLIAEAMSTGRPPSPTRAERLQRVRDQSAAAYLAAVARN